MLTLWRGVGRYQSSTIVLMYRGQVLGEIVVMQAHGNGVGGANVQIGLNLHYDIEVVRADAQHRPSGPSDEWLASRIQEFELRASGHSQVARSLPFEAVGPYGASSGKPGDAPDDDPEDDPEDGSAADGDGEEGDDWAATRPAPAARPAASAYRAPTRAPAPPATNATTRYVFRASDAERQAGR